MRVFEIIGPIMFGPSSSHTAGACRLSRAIYQLAGGQIDRAHLLLHGSFQIDEGEQINKALVAGLLGMDTDDDKINDSYTYMERSQIKFSYENTHIKGAHHNTVRYIIRNKDISFTATSVSIGGGMIEIRDINGVQLSLTGAYNTIVIYAHSDESVCNFLNKHMGKEESLEIFSADSGEKMILYKSEFSSVYSQFQEIRKMPSVRYAALLEKFD